MKSFENLKKFLISRNFTHMSETSWQDMLSKIEQCEKDITVLKTKASKKS